MIFTKTKQCKERCPYCDSDKLLYETTEILDNTLRYPATCLNCSGEFAEDYDIVYSETTYREVEG